MATGATGAGAAPATITVLRTLGPVMAKTWCADGSIKNYDEAKHYKVREVPVASLSELHKLLMRLQGDDAALHCIIRGKPKAPIGKDAVVRRTLEVFEDQPSHLFMVDVDKFECMLADPIEDPASAIAEFVATLPDCFRDSAYVWQMSGSAGHPSKPRNVLRAHVWFWLQHPLTCAEAEAWSRKYLPQADCTVHRTVQVNYTAPPVLQGVFDPLAGRRLGFAWLPTTACGQEIVYLPDDMPVPELHVARGRKRREHVDPRGKPGVIGAVCRAWEPHEIVDLFPELFVPGRSDDRITWLTGGGTPEGVCVTDDGLGLYSSHSTAPVQYGNLFDFIRAHAFGHLDTLPDDVYEFDPTARPSYQAVIEWALQQPEVQAQLDTERPEVVEVIEQARDKHAEQKLESTTDRAQRMVNILRAIERADTRDVLQHKVCREIAKVKDLDEGDREELARAVNARTAALLKPTGGSARGIGLAIVRKWLAPVLADGAAVFPDRGEGGELKATLANFRVLLQRMEIVCRYNEITKRQEVIVPGVDAASNNAQDVVVTHVWSNMNQAGFAVSRDSVRALIVAVCEENPYNPVDEWIAAQPWDGRDRITELAATIEHDHDFSAALKTLILRRWLIQAVAVGVSRHPVQARGVLVLQGEQYIGKTRWLQRLGEPVLTRLVKTGHHLDPHNKDSIKIAVSHWITELGELGSTMRKSDRDALKAFLSQDVDTMRLPYAAGESIFRRQTAFVGSVNDDTFLSDPTGNTRFWPIPVRSLNADHEIDMQQVWAQAYALWQAGEPHWMTPEEMSQVRLSNERFEVEDPITEKLRSRYAWHLITGPQWHTDPACLAEPQALTATQALQNMGIERPTPSETSRCGSALRKLGAFQPKRSGTSRGWLVPVDVSSVEGFNDLAK